MANTIDTDAKIISPALYGFGQPALCRCSNTLMFAAHINNSSQLEIHKSIDDGVNWSLVKTFSESSPEIFEMCPIDANSAGIIFSYDTNKGRVYVTIDNGNVWANKLNTTTLGTKNVNIAYDPIESRLWANWFDGTNIKLPYSDNKGDNWTDAAYNIGAVSWNITDMDVSPYNSDVYVTPILSVGQGRVYKFDKTGSYISNLTLQGNYNNDGCIVFDSNGNYMVIEGYRIDPGGGYRFYLGASLNGANFTNLIPGEVTRPWVIGSVSVGVDGDDNVYAFYTKVSDEKTYYRKYNGSSWESEVILVGVANDRISCEKRPISGSNKLHFVYYKAP